MGQIVTFYSYKGGVGRSMAMANIAVLLAKRGLRVLAVDWDLEAPGLERYFGYFEMNQVGEGLLNLLIDKSQGRDVELADYIWQIDVEPDNTDGELHFMPSGKETDDDYAAKLERFDWDSYFTGGGGDYLEAFRDYCKKRYDVTLIDSRTGLSDAGGVCTIQLPDVAVAMFTANYQSLYGVRDIMRLAQAARHDLAYERTQLAVVPLPSRFGSRSEFSESQEWLDRFADALTEFYTDWLPSWLDTRRVVEALKIPQVDYFGFGERLAVVEQGTSDPDGLGFIYDRVASLIADDLQGVEDILGFQSEKEYATEITSPAPSKKSTPDYTYDLYISYAQDAVLTDYLRVFVENLEQWVGLTMGEDPKIFFDFRELSLGETMSSTLADSLTRSKLLMPILTPRYFRSKWAQAEWRLFADRERASGVSPLILPVLMHKGSDLPKWAYERQFYDMSDVPLHAGAFRDKRHTLRMTERIQELAKMVAKYLENSPKFDTTWAAGLDIANLNLSKVNLLKRV